MTNDPIKPVAWMRELEDGWRWTRIEAVADIWRDQGCQITPLYSPEVRARAERGERAKALLAEAEKALTWAIPLAAQYLGIVMGERAKAGHDNLGTKYGTLYDAEASDRDFARATLTKIQEARHADNG